MGKSVFVLGAGFSKSFCPEMPTMSDLDSYLNNHDELAFLYPALHEFIKKIRTLSKDTAQDNLNIESILTVILTKSLYKDINEKQFYEHLKEDILRFIEHTIKDASKSIIRECAHPILKQFVWHLINKQASIVTFNYDDLIENSTHRPIHLCVNPYAEEINVGSPRGKLQLIKIHGSLDWYQTLGSSSIELETVRVVKSNSYYRQIHQDQTPVFIPMSHNKDAFFKGSLFNTLWAMAISALKSADEIIFIGYSFPKTDINNLLDFLEFKEKIKHVIVYKNSQQDIERLKHLFGDRVIEKDAKEYITNLIIENLPNDMSKESETSKLRLSLLGLQEYESMGK